MLVPGHVSFTRISTDSTAASNTPGAQNGAAA
jgi:hypothetical protein